MQATPENLPNGTLVSSDRDGQTFFHISRRLIMNQDLNAAGRLFGGRLMEWVDEASALFCMSQVGTRQIVTKKISEVIFNEPADLGDVLEILCRVKAVGKSSMTLECAVVTKIIGAGERKRLIVQCDLVFVAIDKQGRAIAHNYSPENARQLNNGEF